MIKICSEEIQLFLSNQSRKSINYANQNQAIGGATGLFPSKLNTMIIAFSITK